jgi:hypothetical protein
MPKTVATSVQELVIDLNNYRTVAQPDDIQAIQAMISIGSDEFWALMESLIDDGYLPTENIIVLEVEGPPKHLLVKEGNRRAAALKLIHGHLPIANFPVPEEILKKINGIPPDWKLENAYVPCAIYPAEEATTVDKIVTLTHGKAEKAGRHNWNAVAHARHNRDFNKIPENALDLLEKYLVHGENLSKIQAKLWGGKYRLSVLDEALGILAQKFAMKNGAELAKTYPALPNKFALDEVLRDIGVEIIGFPTVRAQKDWLDKYLPPQNGTASSPTASTQASAAGPTSGSTGSNTGASQTQAGGASSSAAQATTTGASGTQTSSPTTKGVAAVAINDPRSVKRALKKFSPIGINRQKIVTLRNEATKLDLADNPIAFCFLLRSMFEISAKAYCEDHKSNGGPSYTKPNGSYNTLEDVLRETAAHLTKNNSDMVMVKALHGAMTELAKKDSILSVTSMNQLVHNPTFAIVPSDIPTIFGHIFPLLEAMNS